MHPLTTFTLRLLRIQKISLHPLFCQGTSSHLGATSGSSTSRLLTSELKRCFQQKCSLPMAAMVETLLVTAANCTSVDLGELTEELKLCEYDIDLKNLKTQLQMLPDLVQCEGS